MALAETGDSHRYTRSMSTGAPSTPQAHACLSRPHVHDHFHVAGFSCCHYMLQYTFFRVDFHSGTNPAANTLSQPEPPPALQAPIQSRGGRATPALGHGLHCPNVASLRRSPLPVSPCQSASPCVPVSICELLRVSVSPCESVTLQACSALRASVSLCEAL